MTSTSRKHKKKYPWMVIDAHKRHVYYFPTKKLANEFATEARKTSDLFLEVCSNVMVERRC